MMQIEENGHQMGFSRKFMMENAGAAVANQVVKKWHHWRRGLYPTPIDEARVLVFAGLGNNGGDGLVIARHLAGHGASVTVFLLGEPDNIRTEECSWNWSLLEKMKSIKLLTDGNLEHLNNLEFDVIIDGILGTGISGEIREPHASAITFINESKNRGKKKIEYKNLDLEPKIIYRPSVVAVDVPSGLNPDTGETNQVCVNANMTVTFHRMKVGMDKREDVCGEIFVEKIGIPPEAEDGVL
jgi:NAD(P)H-hydrate epimerase